MFPCGFFTYSLLQPERRGGKLQRCEVTQPRLSRTPVAAGGGIRVSAVPNQCLICRADVLWRLMHLCFCFFFPQNILIDLLLTRSLLYPHNKISLSGCFQTAIFFLRGYYSPARFSCLPEWLRGCAAQRGEVNCLEDAVLHAGFGAPSVLQLGQGQVTSSSDMEHDASYWCGTPCAQRRACPCAGRFLGFAPPPRAHDAMESCLVVCPHVLGWEGN